MQVILERLLIAAIGAIAILIVLILLGVSIGYREEFERSRIILYARFIVTPILMFVTAYLYVQGQLDSETLFFVIMWLLPVILCTDWKRARLPLDADQKPLKNEHLLHLTHQRASMPNTPGNIKNNTSFN